MNVVHHGVHARYRRVPGGPMGREVHLWSYGHAGRPVLAFPSAGGYAHEWQQHGMIAAVADLIAAGRLQVFCPESNVAAAWMHATGPIPSRLSHHQAYEDFIVHHLLPSIRQATGRSDVLMIGCSMGAYYTANVVLKHPEAASEGVCLSGRYDMRPFFGAYDGLDAYYNNPAAYVWNLHGDHLQRLQRAHLTLIVGQGAYEGRCLPETRQLAEGLGRAGVPHHLDVWGRDVSHEWHWWRRQWRREALRRT